MAIAAAGHPTLAASRTAAATAIQPAKPSAGRAG